MVNLTNNVLHAYRAASPQFKREGAAWYDTAAEVSRGVAEVAGIPFENGAAIVAALSPRCQWSKNIEWAYAIAHAHYEGLPLPLMGLGNNLRRATIALTSLDDIKRSKGTLKVYNFYGSIVGIRGSVCIDTHAVRIAEGNPKHSGLIGGDRKYHMYADAYRQAARTIRRSARDIQAITWVDFRGRAH
jgi:hypothetical protein